jgi:hypothetical protein
MAGFQRVRPEVLAVPIAATGAETPLTVRLVADLPMVWRHHCGHLNEGVHRSDSVCAGCSADARPHEVEGRYLLVEMGGS